MELVLLVLAAVAVSVHGGAITAFTRNISISHGDDSRLECITSGVSISLLSWSRITIVNDSPESDIISYGEDLVHDGRDHTVSGSQARYSLSTANNRYTIDIRNSIMKDEGKWECVVNQGGDREAVWLTVKTKPTITRIKEDFNAIENKTYTIFCEAVGSPKPSIVWSKPSSKLPNGQFLSHGRLLELANMTSEHRGVYQCSASNTEGSARDTVTIRMDHKPKLTVDKERVRAELKETASMTCYFEATPTASVTKWTKGNSGSEVRNDIKNEIKVDIGTAQMTLTFGDLRREDFGDYRCEVRNIRGMSRKTIVLEEGAGEANPKTGRVSGSAVLSASFVVMATALMTSFIRL